MREKDLVEFCCNPSLASTNWAEIICPAIQDLPWFGGPPFHFPWAPPVAHVVLGRFKWDSLFQFFFGAVLMAEMTSRQCLFESPATRVDTIF